MTRPDDKEPKQSLGTKKGPKWQPARKRGPQSCILEEMVAANSHMSLEEDPKV